jgi:hypothetical protein
MNDILQRDSERLIGRNSGSRSLTNPHVRTLDINNYSVRSQTVAKFVMHRPQST